MVPEYFQRYKKYLVWLCVALALWLVLYLAFNFWESRTKATLVIDGAPPDLTMTLGEKKIKSPGKLYVTEGDYELTFARPEFSTFKKKVSLKTGKKTVVLVPLTATTQAGKDYLKKHPEVQAAIERISGKLDAQNSNDLLQRFPLISVLPTTQAVGGAGEFKINYRVNVTSSGEQSAEITITYDTEAAKQQALAWIKYRGFDPSKYTINYVSTLDQRKSNID